MPQDQDTRNTEKPAQPAQPPTPPASTAERLQDFRRKARRSSINVLLVVGAMVVVAILTTYAWNTFGLKSSVIKPGTTTYAPTDALGNDIQPTATYKDSAGHFNLTYLQGWRVLPQPEAGKGSATALPKPDWSKQSRPIMVEPPDGHPGNNVMITPGCTQDTINQLIAQKAKKSLPPGQRDINGAESWYDMTSFQTPYEQYVDHQFILRHKLNCLDIHYRQLWKHPMGGTDFNDSKNVKPFMDMVYTIKFND